VYEEGTMAQGEGAGGTLGYILYRSRHVLEEGGWTENKNRWRFRQKKQRATGSLNSYRFRWSWRTSRGGTVLYQELRDAL